MKRIILTLIWALATLMSTAQATIDRALQEELTRRNDDEKIEVIVLMKAQSPSFVTPAPSVTNSSSAN